MTANQEQKFIGQEGNWESERAERDERRQRESYWQSVNKCLDGNSFVIRESREALRIIQEETK